MNTQPSLHRRLLLIFVCLIVVAGGSSGGISLAHQTEVPSERTQPLPTTEPTRAPRPTPVPTQAPRPTLEPTQPPVQVTPELVPTWVPPNLDPAPPDAGDSLPHDVEVPNLFDSTIVNTTRICPHTFNPYQRGVTVASLDNMCTAKPMANLYYVYQPPTGGDKQNEKHGNGVTHTVKPGVWTIVITQMPGFDIAAAACAVSPPQAPKSFVPLHALPNHPEDRIDVKVEFAKTTSCTWYLHSIMQTSELTIHLWQCPVGYLPLAPGADPAAECTVPIDGVRFLMYAEPQIFVIYGANTGDAGPGAAYFHSIPPNPMTIYDWMQGQAGAMTSGCEGFGLAGADILLQQVDPGASLTCHWYYVPAN